MSSDLTLPAGMLQFLSDLPADVPIWLVGGATRDHLLGRENRDLDFAVDGDALGIAKSLADRRGGYFYHLDRERSIGRVMLKDEHGDRYTLDFAKLRGATIEEDLRGRDFTINAIAVRLTEPYKWIDPLGGAGDIRAKVMNTCTSRSILDDPVRAVRAVRLAITFGFQIATETRAQIERVKDAFETVSAERVRDEIMHICDMPHPGKALRLLDYLDLTAAIFPEVDRLRRVSLPSPYEINALEHTFAVLERSADLLSVLRPVHDPEAAGNMILAQVALRLGRFRDNLHAHFERHLGHEHRARQLLFLAALYHAVGLSALDDIGESEGQTTVSCAARSAEMIEVRSRALRLSRNEIDHLGRIVRHLSDFADIGFDHTPSAKTVYRFFRRTGDAGVEVVLLSLADYVAAHATRVSQDDWATRVELGRTLLEAYFEHRDSKVDPPALIDGDDVMRALNLDAGPRVGELLEIVREAQVAGEVATRADALSFLHQQQASEEAP